MRGVTARVTPDNYVTCEMSRRRVFTDGDRSTFFDAIVKMRQTCVDACRLAPVAGPDYRVASELIQRLDDAVEALTGDRKTLWLQPHATQAEPADPALPDDHDTPKK